MNKNTGLNTKDPSAEENTTVTYVIETEEEKNQSTIAKVTPSQNYSTDPVSKVPERSENASNPPLPVDSIEPHDLPGDIIAALAGNVDKSHFGLVIPNTSAAIVTRESIADIPHGYILVLVFDDQTKLPDNHIEGKSYILS